MRNRKPESTVTLFNLPACRLALSLTAAGSIPLLLFQLRCRSWRFLSSHRMPYDSSGGEDQIYKEKKHTSRTKGHFIHALVPLLRAKGGTIGSDSSHEYSFKQKESFYPHCPSLEFQQVIIANPKLGMCHVVPEAALLGMSMRMGNKPASLTDRWWSDYTPDSTVMKRTGIFCVPAQGPPPLKHTFIDWLW